MWKAVGNGKTFGENVTSTNEIRALCRRRCKAHKDTVAFTVYFKPEGGRWITSGTVEGNNRAVFWFPRKGNVREIKYDGSLK